LRFCTYSPHLKSFKIILVNTNSAFGSLQHMDVDSVADASDVNFASVCMTELSRMSECSCVCRFWSNRQTGEEGGG
jgi:hypothetical protein